MPWADNHRSASTFSYYEFTTSVSLIQQSNAWYSGNSDPLMARRLSFFSSASLPFSPPSLTASLQPQDAPLGFSRGLRRWDGRRCRARVFQLPRQSSVAQPQPLCHFEHHDLRLLFQVYVLPPGMLLTVYFWNSSSPWWKWGRLGLFPSMPSKITVYSFDTICTNNILRRCT